MPKGPRVPAISDGTKALGLDLAEDCFKTPNADIMPKAGPKLRVSWTARRFRPRTIEMDTGTRRRMEDLRIED
jgi:hypothetical protein